MNCRRRTGRIARMKPTILFREESYAIMGACFEVYKRKGCGFTEPMYQECVHILARPKPEAD